MSPAAVVVIMSAAADRAARVVAVVQVPAGL